MSPPRETETAGDDGDVATTTSGETSPPVPTSRRALPPPLLPGGGGTRHVGDIGAIERAARVTNRVFAIRTALAACDQGGFDRLAVRAALEGWGALFEVAAPLELAGMPHDVQVWWNGECNCDGHLN